MLYKWNNEVKKQLHYSNNFKIHYDIDCFAKAAPSEFMIYN